MANSERVTGWLGSAAAVAAAAVAVGVAEVVAVFTGAESAPLVAVGGVVIDAVPASVKNFATSTFGTHDKQALLIGTTILLAIFAAVIGALAVRDLRFGLGGIALFGAIGVTAALTRHGADAAYALPALLGATAGGVTLDALLRKAATGYAGLAEEAARRKMLTTSGGVLVGGAVLGLIGRQLGERSNVSAARAAVTLPTPASPAPALPAQVDLHLPDLTNFVTANDNFYRIDTALTVPQVDPKTWQLTIHGKVRRPITLTFEQLLKRPMIERYVTLACVSNEVGDNLISNTKWLGVPVKDLLAEAGPLAGADQVVGRAVDGFTTGTPTELLLDGRDAMLAVAMNGAPLPVEHGFPVRMVVPGLYGYVSATKWITELELTSFADFDAYWVQRGWSQEGPIKTESRIDTPRDGSSPRTGQVTVAGVAWAQHRGISKVEVQVDGGAWHQATLAAVPSVDTWRQWFWKWSATPGQHTLAVRATDNSGATQTEQEAPSEPNGATGWHTIIVHAK